MRPQIVLFGDSITEQSFRYGGWGASLTDTYSRKVDIVVRGYGGYNTRWALFMLNHIFPLGSTTPPAATTVFFGANDAALSGRTSERQHVPLEEYKENLRKIVHHLKECSPTMLVVLITPPPIDEEGRQEYAKYNSFQNFISKYLFENLKVVVLVIDRSMYGEKAMKLPERTNEVTGSYANGCVEVAKELGVASVNLWSKMQETKGWQKKFLSDGLHLTGDGNAIVYEEVVRELVRGGFSANAMRSDFPHHSEIHPQNPEKVFHQRGL